MQRNYTVCCIRNSHRHDKLLCTLTNRTVRFRRSRCDVRPRYAGLRYHLDETRAQRSGLQQIGSNSTWALQWRYWPHHTGFVTRRITILLVRLSHPRVSIFLTQLSSATVGFNIVAAVVILVPSVPIAYGNTLSVSNSFIVNAMASRAYRQLKLENAMENLDSPLCSLSIEFRGRSSGSSIIRRQTTQDSSSSQVDASTVIHLHSGDTFQGSATDTISKEAV